MNIISLLFACQTEKGITETDSAIVEEEPAQEELPPSCGDGIVNQFQEECDDGVSNSDTTPNACRSDCTFPQCGDAIFDDLTEQCDDGNVWNQDGCSTSCQIEEGIFEEEPNSTPAQAQSTERVGFVQGSLWEGDMDCFSLQVQENDYAKIWVSGQSFQEEIDEETSEITIIEECTEQAQLHLYQDGSHAYTAYPQEAKDCVSMAYSQSEFLRFMEEGIEHVVCIEGFLGTALSSYQLNWEIQTDSCTLTDISFTTDEDPDFDLLANNCDSDDDNDGLFDEQDNCPVHPNNGPVFYYTDADGFIRDWLVLGPISGQSTTACAPVASLTVTTETDLMPNLGDEEVLSNGSTKQWGLFQNSSSSINFLLHSALGAMSAPREVFAATWIYSPQARDSQIKIGPDDGAKVWVNGALVGETTVCQGVSIDKYTYDAPLVQGWNRLVIQVRDNGGGWGLYARFTENGTPITDIDISPAAQSYLQDEQMDSDGDGIGDQCDN